MALVEADDGNWPSLSAASLAGDMMERLEAQDRILAETRRQLAEMCERVTKLTERAAADDLVLAQMETSFRYLAELTSRLRTKS